MSADIGALPAESAQRSLGRFALRFRVSGVLAFLILLCAGFAVLRPQFLTPENLSAILSNAAILMIVAAAQAVILITRNLDVSVGSIMGFAAYLTADFAARHHGVGGALVFMPLAIGGGLGAINGLLVAYGRISPLIATLGTMSVYRGLTYVYARGQEVTSNKLPHWMIELADMRIGVVPLLALLSAAVVCVLAAFLRFYPLGRRMYAVGSNPEASAFFGLRTQRIVLLAYVVGGVMCGLAGFLYAARVGTVTVILASGWELTSLAAAVIGGVSVTGGSGNVIGAGLGAIVLATIDNGLVLLGVPEFWRMFIQGVAIVGAATADVVIAARIREFAACGTPPQKEQLMNQRLPQWELTLIVLTLAAAAWSATLSPYYLSVGQILYSTRQFVYPGILSIGLAVVVILSEIDISLASTLAFGGVLFSKFSAFGVPIWLAVPCVVAACAALGTPERRSRRPDEPALARSHAWHDGRLPGPGLHHRIGDGLHELRRFLSLSRIGEAVRRPTGLLSPVPCARNSCWRTDALDGVRASLLRRRPQQGSRLGGRHRRRPDQD